MKEIWIFIHSWTASIWLYENNKWSRMWSKWIGNSNVVKFHARKSHHGISYECAICAMAVFMWVIYSKVFVCWNLLSIRSYQMCIALCGCENFRPNIKFFSHKYLLHSEYRHIACSCSAQSYRTDLSIIRLPFSVLHFALTVRQVSPFVSQRHTNQMQAKFGAPFSSLLNWLRETRQVRTIPYGEK